MVNPVLFTDEKSIDGLSVFSENLDEMDWENKMVGACEQGIFIVIEKIPQSGFYNFPATLVNWDQLETIAAKIHYSLFGVLTGIAIIAYGIFLFYAYWFGGDVFVPGGLTGPPAMLLSGTVLIFGLKRVRIIIECGGGTFKFTSKPFSFTKGKRFANDVYVMCREKGLFIQYDFPKE